MAGETKARSARRHAMAQRPTCGIHELLRGSKEAEK
jgi:hypothetical protein